MAAMRRLNRAVAGFHAPDDEFDHLVKVATELAQRFEQGEPRSKLDDMLAVNGGEVMAELAEAPVGSTVSFDPFSAAGGAFNPCAVGMDFVRDGEASVTATTTVDQLFQGPPGRVHGGVVAMLVDEVMGVVNRATGIGAFTARLEISYVAAAPIDQELTLRAWQERVEGRKVFLRAEGASPEGPFVTAEGLFIVPRDRAPWLPGN